MAPSIPENLAAVGAGIRAAAAQCGRAAGSVRLVAVSKTQSAARIRAASRSSRSGTWSAKSGDPHVVRIPRTAIRSFTAIGTPCSHPARGASSAARA